MHESDLDPEPPEWDVYRWLRRAGARGVVCALVLALICGVPSAALLELIDLGWSPVPFFVGAVLGVSVFVPSLLEERWAPSLGVDLFTSSCGVCAALLTTLCLVGSPYYASELAASGDIERAVLSGLKLGFSATSVGYGHLLMLSIVALPWSLVVGVATLGEFRAYTRARWAIALGLVSGVPLVLLIGLGLVIGAPNAHVPQGFVGAAAGLLGLCLVFCVRRLYDLADRWEARLWASPELVKDPV